jgi:hypothetical protein
MKSPFFSSSSASSASSRSARGVAHLQGASVWTAEMGGMWRERCAHLAERDGYFAGALCAGRGLSVCFSNTAWAADHREEEYE